MSEKRKVVIDCDPGIDDTFALVMCINKLDVKGIVAVGGNTGLEYTQRNARYVTEITKRTDLKPAGACHRGTWKRRSR